MQHHTHAPPGASGGHAALARLLEADWSRGVPEAYLEALERIRTVRSQMAQAIADAIDDLDILDMAIADLEPEEDANEEDLGGEPSLGAPEAVTCGDGPATPVRKARRKTCQLASLPSANLQKVHVDRSCDQERWAQGTSDAYVGHGAELDTADDEPSLGAVERHPVVGFYAGLVIDPRASQEKWATDQAGFGVSRDDREQDAGDEPEEENEHADDSDREPSLGSVGAGSPSTMSQTAWAVGAQDDREAVNEDGGDINDEPCDDNELDGHAYDDMEPGGDIEGGTYRGRYRPSVDVIGDSDAGAGRLGFARYGGGQLVAGRVVEGGGVAVLATVIA